MSTNRIQFMLEEETYQNQHWLIERIRKAGYDVEGGQCFGVAHTGVDSILASTLTSLNKLLKVVHDTPKDTLADVILDAKKTLMKLKLVQSAKENIRAQWITKFKIKKNSAEPENFLSLKNQKKFYAEVNNLIQTKIEAARAYRNRLEQNIISLVKKSVIHLLKKNSLAQKPFDECWFFLAAEEQQLFLDMLDYKSKDIIGKLNTSQHEKLVLANLSDTLNIPAMFEKIIIYQLTYAFPQLLSSKKRLTTQQAEPAFPLLLSTDLEKLGGKVRLTTITGIYTEKELIHLYTELENAFANFNYPIAMLLGSANHAMTIGHNQEFFPWKWIDANSLLVKQFSDPLAFGSKIILGLFGYKCSAFSTSIYIAADPKETHQSKQIKKHIKHATKLIQLWKNSPEFKKMHTVTTDKAKEVDEEGVNWLYIVAREGDVPLAKELIAYGADVNQRCDRNSGSPLYASIREGHIEMTKLLLEAKSEVNFIFSEKVHVLKGIAKSLGRETQLSQLFGQHPGIIKDKYVQGLTPLMLAAYCGHASIVSLLLKHGADITMTCFNDIDALKMADLMGHKNVVSLLLKARLEKIKHTIKEVSLLSSSITTRHIAIAKLKELSNKTPLSIESIKQLETIIHDFTELDQKILSITQFEPGLLQTSKKSSHLVKSSLFNQPNSTQRLELVNLKNNINKSYQLYKKLNMNNYDEIHKQHRFYSNIFAKKLSTVMKPEILNEKSLYTVLAS